MSTSRKIIDHVIYAENESGHLRTLTLKSRDDGKLVLSIMRDGASSSILLDENQISGLQDILSVYTAPMSYNSDPFPDAGMYS